MKDFDDFNTYGFSVESFIISANSLISIQARVSYVTESVVIDYLRFTDPSSDLRQVLMSRYFVTEILKYPSFG